MKQCIKCKILKSEELFPKQRGNICKLCKSIYIKSYYKKNRLKVKRVVKNYYINNKKKYSDKQKKYYENNKEKIKIKMKKYYENNKKKILTINNEYVKKRRRVDPVFAAARDMATKIRREFKKVNITKKYSIWKFLPYTPQQLKEHIECQFENWMHWGNRGIYKINEWNDSDSSTWKWNIDHIIPQSDLPYTSMEDENFKKCWSLENLRPYSAKQNVLDGISRARHLNEIKRSI